MISNAVIVGSTPAVYISGGLDSTIILHHLRQKTEEKIYTYTFGFPDDDEFDYARKVADYYETNHTEILIREFLPRFPEILKHFERPRWNIWIYWLAEQAQKDARKTCYTGEGCDEHFGGYYYKPKKSYLEKWVDHFVYVLPTYNTVHTLFGLTLEQPFTRLDWTKSYLYFDHENMKTHLRKAYRNLLPKFVVERQKQRGGPDYWKLWKRELRTFFPGIIPNTEEEIRNLLNLYATKTWLNLFSS